MSGQPSPIVRNIPNALTTLRLAIVPVFIALVIYEQGASLAAGLLFMGAAFTDFFDGYIARRFGLLSQYGKVLDPIADRLLVNSAAVLLCIYDSAWFGDGRLLGIEFIVVIARDVLVIIGYLLVRSRVVPDINAIGKLGMALMMAGLAWLLVLPDATWPVWPFEAGLVLSIVAFVQYFIDYRGVISADVSRG